MSTLKATNLQHASSSTANLVLAADGTVSGGLPYPNRNLLYNGAMQVAQRSTSVAGITSGGYYTADRYVCDVVNGGTWTQSVENDAPSGSGLRKSLKMLCTTADTSLATTDRIIIQQNLEGQDLQRVAKGTASAQQLRLSFWVKGSTTGTYIAELEDADNSRQVSVAYSITQAGTWERKTLTFPADTTGAFDNDSAKSLGVYFWLAAGPSFSSGGALQTSWGNTTANRVVGQTNLAAAVNNYWQVTGVQLEVGPVPTAFEFKSYGQELRECQRYYQRLTSSGANNTFGVGFVDGTNFAYWSVPFTQTMRSAPTAVETSSSGNYQSFSYASRTLTSGPTFTAASPTSAVLTGGWASAYTAGYSSILTSLNASAYLGFSAEL